MGGARIASEIPLLSSFLYLFGESGDGRSTRFVRFLVLRQRQAGSLTGAVHLSNGKAGVLGRAQRGRKPRVEQKGKSSLDLDFQ